jgi:hypothetical protein
VGPSGAGAANDFVLGEALMNFEGFTISDGAWLPPELIYLLPFLSGSKLKVVLVVIYHKMQVGGEEPVSLTDLQNLTGLTRETVSIAARELVQEDGILYRTQVGRSYSYDLTIRKSDSYEITVRKSDSNNGRVGKSDHPDKEMVGKSDYLSTGESDSSTRKNGVGTGESDSSMRKNGGRVGKSDHKIVKLRESDRKLTSNTNTDSLSDSLDSNARNENFLQLIRQLRAAGVFLKTAQGLLAKYDPDLIRRHLKYYAYALQSELAQGPGWLVLSIKENWPAPPGFEEDKSEAGDKGWGCPECHQSPCICGEGDV